MSESPRPGITIDVIIARFVPIIGAILFITGLGYLIYTSVWKDLTVPIRLGLGFFTSFLIIGGAFSLSDRIKYFSDVIMGGGILLLYGTLIYGSRTTDIAQAVIPEMATIVTGFFFTVAVAYFASLRKSKVILALGMLGAYLTPFVIGQNDVWASNISFNAYLVYFAAINIVIFLLGREIAIYDLIPLNLIGLFFGTTTLHALVYADKTPIETGILASETFTLILLTILVIMSITGIALSSRYFHEKKEEIMLSLGYLVPLGWFLVHTSQLNISTPWIHVIAYIIIAGAYFFAWHILRPLQSVRYQHIATYAGGIIAIILAITKWFPDMNLYTSLIIAYGSLIFSILYYIDDSGKGERLLSAILFSSFGAIMTLSYIYGGSAEYIRFPTTWAVGGLIPAILLYPIALFHKKTPASIVSFLKVYSGVALLLALALVALKALDIFDLSFVLFIVPGMTLIIWTYIMSPADKRRKELMPLGALLLSIGFFSSFIYLVANLAPHVADDSYFFTDGAVLQNGYFLKGVIAVIGYFLALSVSRDIQKTDSIHRPSFLLVVLGYTTLLLVVNFSIITLCNDLNVPKVTGGIRAIGTTIWWIVLAIAMIMIGVYKGSGHRSEKLAGLILLLLTIAKIAIYDLSAMDMNKKIVVLMVVGGIIMMFSYFLQVKGYLKADDPESQES